jgi:hypothetical protein
MIVAEARVARHIVGWWPANGGADSKATTASAQAAQRRALGESSPAAEEDDATEPG